MDIAINHAFSAVYGGATGIEPATSAVTAKILTVTH